MKENWHWKKKFSKKVKRKRKLRNKYAGVLDELNGLYKRQEDYTLARNLYSELLYRNVEIFGLIRQIDLLKKAFEGNGVEQFNAYKNKADKYFNRFYSKYRNDIDREVMAGQFDVLKKYMPPHLLSPQLKSAFSQGKTGSDIIASTFDKSVFQRAESFDELMTLAPEEFAKKVNEDPTYQLFQDIQNYRKNEVDNMHRDYQDQISSAQRKYMQAQMDVFKKKKKFYPDANGTLRVSYGLAEGYETEEAGRYPHVTYLEGVIKKYKPGDYEFDVSPKLISLYESKDYGNYADKNGKMPVCFIGSNHTSGGNSGSPAIDAHGNLIGLNFDRVWEGTMSDMNYDRSICRNIMVDARYILFIVDKYGGATHLIDEMKLVHPKS